MKHQAFEPATFVRSPREAIMQQSFNVFRHGRLSLALATALLASCAGNVEVGQAKPAGDQEATQSTDTSSASDDSTTGDSTSGGSGTSGSTTGGGSNPRCTETDALIRERYDSWLSTPNDLSPLVGKTFTGYIEAGPDLRLMIGADQTATLVVGDPAAPPVKNGGYLCGEDPGSTAECDRILNTPPIVGGTYPLHGATLEDHRFLAPLQDHIPWAPWCALQTPIPMDDDECFFRPVKNGITVYGNHGCSVDGSSVDCGWLALAETDVCACTSSQCYPAVYSGDVDVDAIDARLNDDADEIVGSYRGNTVYLFEAKD